MHDTSILITSKTFNGKMEIVYICSMIWANNAALLIVLIIFVCARRDLTVERFERLHLVNRGSSKLLINFVNSLSYM